VPALGHHDLESAAHGARSLTPDQEDLRRILNDDALEISDALAVLVVGRRVADPVQSRIDQWIRRWLEVERDI